MQDCTYLVFHLIWIEFILIPCWIQLNNNNNNKRHGSGSGVWSKQSCIKAGCLGTRVITASSYKVAVLIMCHINYVTHQCLNATQNTPHKSSPGEGLQSLIALFLVDIVMTSMLMWTWLLDDEIVDIWLVCRLQRRHCLNCCCAAGVRLGEQYFREMCDIVDHQNNWCHQILLHVIKTHAVVHGKTDFSKWRPTLCGGCPWALFIVTHGKCWSNWGLTMTWMK